MGRLIPAGTGFEYYRHVRIPADEPPPPPQPSNEARSAKVGADGRPRDERRRRVTLEQLSPVTDGARHGDLSSVPFVFVRPDRRASVPGPSSFTLAEAVSVAFGR